MSNDNKDNKVTYEKLLEIKEIIYWTVREQDAIKWAKAQNGNESGIFQMERCEIIKEIKDKLSKYFNGNYNYTIRDDHNEISEEEIINLLPEDEWNIYCECFDIENPMSYLFPTLNINIFSYLFPTLNINIYFVVGEDNAKVYIEKLKKIKGNGTVNIFCGIMPAYNYEIEKPPTLVERIEELSKRDGLDLNRIGIYFPNFPTANGKCCIVGTWLVGNSNPDFLKIDCNDENVFPLLFKEIIHSVLREIDIKFHNLGKKGVFYVNEVPIGVETNYAFIREVQKLGCKIDSKYSQSLEILKSDNKILTIKFEQSKSPVKPDIHVTINDKLNYIFEFKKAGYFDADEPNTQNGIEGIKTDINRLLGIKSQILDDTSMLQHKTLFGYFYLFKHCFVKNKLQKMQDIKSLFEIKSLQPGTKEIEKDIKYQLTPISLSYPFFSTQAHLGKDINDEEPAFIGFGLWEVNKA
ncbi:MAG: hypothetical protein HQK79_23000 [Desulfobacterales bacterium]|nr:hypothetical protein [Desulfobacterales bacterium]